MQNVLNVFLTPTFLHPKTVGSGKTQKVDFCFPFQILHTKMITYQNDRSGRTKRFVFTIIRVVQMGYWDFPKILPKEAYQGVVILVYGT